MLEQCGIWEYSYNTYHTTKISTYQHFFASTENEVADVEVLLISHSSTKAVLTANAFSALANLVLNIGI